MAASNAACDVLVVGGGPAAATAARLLARWGRRVVVVARPAGGEPELPESLTPSCGKFFDLLGIRARIDGAGFVRSAGHTVWWGSAAARAEPFADGSARLAGDDRTTEPGDARGRGRRGMRRRAAGAVRRRGAGLAGRLADRLHRALRGPGQAIRRAALRARSPHGRARRTLAARRRVAGRRSEPHPARVVRRRLGLVDSTRRHSPGAGRDGRPGDDRAGQKRGRRGRLPRRGRQDGTAPPEWSRARCWTADPGAGMRRCTVPGGRPATAGCWPAMRHRSSIRSRRPG